MNWHLPNVKIENWHLPRSHARGYGGTTRIASSATANPDWARAAEGLARQKLTEMGVPLA